MKKIISCVVIFLSIVLIGCNKSNEHNAVKKVQKENSAVKHIKVESNKKQLTETQINNKIKDGTAIMLSGNKEATNLNMEGSKVQTIVMPDGNLWKVKQDNGKNFLDLPNGQKVQEKMVNGKMMLLTDNNKKYEVKVINGKMIAVEPSSNNVAMSK